MSFCCFVLWLICGLLLWFARSWNTIRSPSLQYNTVGYHVTDFFLHLTIIKKKSLLLNIIVQTFQLYSSVGLNTPEKIARYFICISSRNKVPKSFHTFSRTKTMYITNVIFLIICHTEKRQ